MAQAYGVTVSPDGTDYVVRARDLDEVVTGSSVAEALALAADAIEVVVSGRIADAMELPEPSPLRPGEHAVTLPTRLAIKAELYRAFKGSGLPLRELARRMNREEADVQRIMDPRHATRLDQLEDAARALGGRLGVSFEAA